MNHSYDKTKALSQITKHDFARWKKSIRKRFPARELIYQNRNIRI